MPIESDPHPWDKHQEYNQEEMIELGPGQNERSSRQPVSQRQNIPRLMFVKKK